MRDGAPAKTGRYAFHHQVWATLRDTDGMGHVNNAVYLSWLEEIRTRYVFSRRGMSSLDEVDFVLASARLDFRSPVHVLETIDLWCEPTRVGGSSWEMRYEARAEVDGRLVLEATTVQVQYDYEARKPAPIPERWRRILERDSGEVGS